MPSALRQALFFLLLIAMPVASWYFFFEPQNKKITKAKEDIKIKEDLLDRLRAATAKAPDLKRQNEETAAKIASIEASLPSSKEMDDILRQVANIAQKNELKIPQFKRSDKILTAGTAMEQPLEIEITGNFDGFYQFLLELEKLQRITRIPDFSIVRADEKDGEMETKLTLAIYYQAESKEGVK